MIKHAIAFPTPYVLCQVFLLAGLFLLNLPMASQAQEVSTPDRVLRILEHNGKHFSAYVDEKTGTPTWILDVDSLDFTLGVQRSLTSEASVKDAARAFLATYAEVFGIHPEQLVLERLMPRGNLWFIGYGQIHQGLPVLNAEVGLTVTQSGRLVAAGVEAFPEPTVDVTPRVSASAAVQVARSLAGLLQEAATGAQDLLIVPEEMEDHYAFRLAWQVRLEDLNRELPVSKTFLIDAHTGSVIAEYDNILEHSAYGDHLPPSSSAHDVQSLQGDTSAFIPTVSSLAPLQAASRAEAATMSNSVWGYVKLNYYETPDDYTNPLIRHTDQPFFDAKVTVKNNQTQQSYTTYANSSGYYSVSGLSTGSHTVTFEIANQKAYIETGLNTSQKTKSFTVNVSGATRQDYDWNWGDSGDGGITSYALNGTFQVRAMYDYVKNTYSYNGMDGWSIRLRIQSTSAGATSRVAGSQAFNIWLGGTEGMSSEVTFHEYAHDVIYRLYNNQFIQTGQSGQTYDEAAAMDEGFADYFAADKTNDHTFGGPEANADPYAPSGDGVAIRFLYNNCTMNDFDGSWPCGGTPHSRGRIIAGAIWRIRTQISTEASHLLFDALQIQPFARTFEDLRARYVAADNARNSGTNAGVIEQKFVERLIGGPNAPSYLTVWGDPGLGDVYLSWNDKSSLEQGYKVERRLNGGAWSTVATLAANSTSYTDQNIFSRSGSNNYEYRVNAYKDALSSYSPVRSYDPCFPAAKHGPGLPPQEATELPRETSLEAAYPNPFNPQTTIRYTLAEEMPVRLVVYDVLGREVTVLVEGTQKAGQHAVVLDASPLPSGLYFYRLETAGKQFSRAILLAK